LAAAAYFLVAIVLGFALGVLRVMFVAPFTGAVVAVLLELPVMLAATWAACRIIIASLKVRGRPTDRLLMGFVALALVLGAELAIAIGLQGRTASEFLQSLGAAEGALGLAAQILFACFPLMQRRSMTA
jgi:hypothetical protein